MTDHITVRPLHAEDLDTVLDIQAACYTGVLPESRQAFAAKLAASPTTSFLALDGNIRLGYLVSVPIARGEPPALDAPRFSLPERADCLYLHDLAVVPHARGSGAASALIDTFLRQAHHHGFSQASLIAVQNSIRYWEKHGFSAFTPTPSLAIKLASYGAGACYMCRDIGIST